MIKVSILSFSSKIYISIGISYSNGVVWLTQYVAIFNSVKRHIRVTDRILIENHCDTTVSKYKRFTISVTHAVSK